MKKTIFCALLVLGLLMTAHYAQASKLELTDGSIIEGQIVSLDKGVYTVNTGGLGQINIDASKISRITTSGEVIPPTINNVTVMTHQEAAAKPSLPSDDEIKSEMERVKSKITNDPETMKNVNALLVDPQFQEILKDPEIVNAAKKHDVKALMQNQKFLNIINNQKIQEIEKKVKDQDK